jgi:hypothetical protein
MLVTGGSSVEYCCPLIVLPACLQVQRKLVIACILCFIFMTVEVIGGYIAKRCVPACSMHSFLCVYCCQQQLIDAVFLGACS